MSRIWVDCEPCTAGTTRTAIIYITKPSTAGAASPTVSTRSAFQGRVTVSRRTASQISSPSGPRRITTGIHKIQPFLSLIDVISSTIKLASTKQSHTRPYTWQRSPCAIRLS